MAPPSLLSTPSIDPKKEFTGGFEVSSIQTWSRGASVFQDLDFVAGPFASVATYRVLLPRSCETSDYPCGRLMQRTRMDRGQPATEHVEGTKPPATVTSLVWRASPSVVLLAEGDDGACRLPPPGRTRPRACFRWRFRGCVHAPGRARLALLRHGSGEQRGNPSGARMGDGAEDEAPGRRVAADSRR